uniref:CS domain-containing protein n=1 Tax=Aureoumbra lagunensis TaxID=44058 RepID=A0A7S3JTU5_9STRA|eukprot:CAMPEP_0197289488 /NCGR_PEP_ID=MMETSP0890-20130614/6763_1 /TAXON_ID=44058 ORGANISM="Aureoumbra lagunensis, Strain CCMP1510" /NCGR_SAMPLE_ID=MMETSP0890 /ASSEMBLY_ACC=CAM_ASM_000533 /LENGTH=699 /DNA_ID=CAMNT_0042760947 /DNA_START=49 /DNA_END=2148 /DNA_ORIENTATION=+
MSNAEWDDDIMIEEEEEEEGESSSDDDDEDILIEDVTGEDEEVPSVEFVEAPDARGAIQVRKAMAPIADADRAKSREWHRCEGNKYYAKKQYRKAVEEYSFAIEADPYDASVYSNRAQAWLSLGQWQSAREDADECVRIDSTNLKGWYRLAKAFEKLEDYEQAISICDTLDDKLKENYKDSQVIKKLKRHLLREAKKFKQKKKIQRDLRELCLEMTPEERRWKAWWAGQGHPNVVDNSNLDKYIPDAKVDVSYDPDVNRVLKGPDNLPRLEDVDEDDDDDILLEDILQAVGIMNTRAITVFEDAGCGPRSLLTCLRLDNSLSKRIIQQLLLPAIGQEQQNKANEYINALKNLAKNEAIDALAKSWEFDALLKFPSSSIRDLPGIGLENQNYSWRQKLYDIEVRLLLPPFTHATDLIVHLSPRRLRVTLNCQALRFWPFAPNSWTMISDVGPKLPPDNTDPLPLEIQEENSESSSVVLVEQVNDSDDDDEPIVEELPVEQIHAGAEQVEQLSNEVQYPRKLNHRDILLCWEQDGLVLKSTEIKQCPPLLSFLQEQSKQEFGFLPESFHYQQHIPLTNDTQLADAFASSSNETANLKIIVSEDHVFPCKNDQGLPSTIVLLDFQLSKKVLVDESIWHISKPEALKDHALQAPVLVILLKKFQNIHKGTAAHHGELWWRHLFLEAGEDCPLTKPPTEFYDLK